MRAWLRAPCWLCVAAGVVCASWRDPNVPFSASLLVSVLRDAACVPFGQRHIVPFGQWPIVPFGHRPIVPFGPVCKSSSQIFTQKWQCASVLSDVTAYQLANPRRPPRQEGSATLQPLSRSTSHEVVIAYLLIAATLSHTLLVRCVAPLQSQIRFLTLYCCRSSHYMPAEAHSAISAVPSQQLHPIPFHTS